MQRPIRTVAPAVRVLSREEVKLHLRVDANADDGLIDGLILAAESRLDGWAGLLGRCMINQTWRAAYRDFMTPVMPLPFPDVSACVVRYSDPEGVEQTIASGNYRLIETAGSTALEWVDGFGLPSVEVRSDAVRIDVTAGYGSTAADVPAAIRHAMKLLIGGWYENREDSVIGVSVAALPMALAAESLIAPYRRIPI